jgi:ATP-dependent RNA helicase SUPV3L1/SUV3
VRGCADLVTMSRYAAQPLVAVLGPTNTGKTHLAIERMCGHSSGMIGFPLRLLAREVYDRVVAIKGKESVALITGEEKILPDHARWFLCTAESMPMERDFAFVALDEAQLGSDPERGHVFTDRLLRARGREETMISARRRSGPCCARLPPMPRSSADRAFRP